MPFNEEQPDGFDERPFGTGGAALRALKSVPSELDEWPSALRSIRLRRI